MPGLSYDNSTVFEMYSYEKAYGSHSLCIFNNKQANKQTTPKKETLCMTTSWRIQKLVCAFLWTVVTGKAVDLSAHVRNLTTIRDGENFQTRGPVICKGKYQYFHFLDIMTQSFQVCLILIKYSMYKIWSVRRFISIIVLFHFSNLFVTIYIVFTYYMYFSIPRKSGLKISR